MPSGGLGKLEKGQDPTTTQFTIHRVDIKRPEQHNVRGATGRESGVNCFFNTPIKNRRLPRIKFCKDEEKRICKDMYGRDIIDADNTDKEMIARLKGRYVTNTGKLSYIMVQKRDYSGKIEKIKVYTPNGTPHEADTTDYAYTTSGGVPEGILSRVPNTSEYISQHTKLTGWKRDMQSSDVRCFVDTEAYRPQEKYVVKYNSLDGKPIQQDQTQPASSNSKMETNKFSLGGKK